MPGEMHQHTKSFHSPAVETRQAEPSHHFVERMGLCSAPSGVCLAAKLEWQCVLRKQLAKTEQAITRIKKGFVPQKAPAKEIMQHNPLLEEEWRLTSNPLVTLFQGMGMEAEIDIKTSRDLKRLWGKNHLNNSLWIKHWIPKIYIETDLFIPEKEAKIL